MPMKVLTVDQLYAALATAKKEGLGKRKILLSGDDEGNSFHEMFFAVSEVTEDYAYALLPVPVEEAMKDYVIVG